MRDALFPDERMKSEQNDLTSFSPASENGSLKDMEGSLPTDGLVTGAGQIYPTEKFGCNAG